MLKQKQQQQQKQVLTSLCNVPTNTLVVWTLKGIMSQQEMPRHYNRIQHFYTLMLISNSNRFLGGMTIEVFRGIT